MGEIIEKKRRDYSGLDADKASIPAGGKAVNDTFLATDTKILYFWDGVAWIIIPLDVIVAGMIKTDAVETAKIKNFNVTAGKLAADSVETLKIKNLNVTAAKAELGFGRYVRRNPTGWDAQVGDFVTDGNWKADALDLSAVVPVGAIAVVLRLDVIDDAANSRFNLRRSTDASIDSISVWTFVANIAVTHHLVLSVDANRLVDYWGSNLAFTTIDLVVLGWFV